MFLRDNHPAYLSWEQYQANLRHLEQHIRRGPVPSPARATTAVLAGLVVCGKCGCHMQTQYTRTLRYVCQRRALDYAAPVCQSLAGAALEQLVREKVLEVVTPAGLELSRARPRSASANAPRWMVNGGYGWSGRLRTPTVYSGSTTPSSRRTAWRRGRWNETGKRLC